MELETLNLNEICRTCKNTEPKMCSLFQEYKISALNIRIDEMLMACAAVQVVCGDGLPEQICQTCTERLSNAFAFKQQCEKVDRNLREYAKNLRNSTIKQEPQHCEDADPLTLPDNFSNHEPALVFKTETSDIRYTENEQTGVLNTSETLLEKDEHKCSKCNKKYTRLKALQKHEISHNHKKVYVCKICSKNLVDTRHLRQHLIVHLKEKPSCNTCNRVFSRVEHLERHTPRCKRHFVYSCDTCNKAFYRKDSLEIHKKTHESETKLPTIDNLDNIKDHYYVVNNDLNTSFSDCYDVDDCSETEIEQENVTEKDATNINVNSEASNVSVTSIGVENRSESDEFLNIEQVKVESTLEELDDTLNCADASGSKRFLCSQCGKSFIRNDFLVIHMRRHTGEKPFKCKYCGKGFVRSADVVAHEKCHTGERPHLCTMCGRAFRWAYNLKVHMKTHSKVKSFRCAYCDAVFMQCEEFERHLQSHEVKDFQCQFSKRFLSGRPLSEQKQTCSSVSKKKKVTFRSKKIVEKKVYKCTICGKDFGKPFYLTVHRKSHDSKTDE